MVFADECVCVCMCRSIARLVITTLPVAVLEQDFPTLDLDLDLVEWEVATTLLVF